MDRKLHEFASGLDGYAVGLFFLAGHGIQIQGKNYLLAVDTKNSDEIAAKHSSLSLDEVIEKLDASNVPMKLIILDACRDNPWERA